MRRAHVLPLLLALAACDAKAPDPPPHPYAANDVVLRVQTVGGFTSFQHTLFVPEFVLYGDGRVVTRGPGYGAGGDALPDVRLRRVPATTIARITAAAREAGVDGAERDYGRGNADAGFTVLELTDARGSVTTRVHDLDTQDTSLVFPKEQRALRQPLVELTRRLADLPGWLGSRAVGPDEPFPTASLLVFARASTDARGRVLRAWRGPDPATGTALAGSFTCHVLSGAMRDTVLPDLTAATSPTSWLYRGTRYYLLARPLLPDEKGCPSA